MGVNVNCWATTQIAWAIAAVITVLNVFLLYQTFRTI
jgi:Mn2+/Fe2+ NRAMP family transporter